MDYGLKCMMCVWIVVLAALAWAGCRDEVIPDESSFAPISLPCSVELVRYPTTPLDFNRVYRNRAFLFDDVHLGRDVDLPEGTPVYPIACGIVREFRPAQGYGTLVVVVEHAFARAKTVRNGSGQSVKATHFLSIYGHLRTTLDSDGELSGVHLSVGERVDPSRPIGYVQRGDKNGDGAEHLHFGIRLQTMEDAQKSDTNWFRGYDTKPTQRGFFTDPYYFMETVVRDNLPVFWHPAGTVLERAHRSDQAFIVGDGNRLFDLPPQARFLARLTNQGVIAQDWELGCYEKAGVYEHGDVSERPMQFDDSASIYLFSTHPAPVRRMFLTADAFHSWGWKDEDVSVESADRRENVLRDYADGGFLGMRAGSIVKARGESEVSIVTGGFRRPFADWNTFVGMGYDPMGIVELDPPSIDAIAGTRGRIIISRQIVSCGGGDVSPPAEVPDASGQPRDMGAADDLNALPDLLVPDFAKSGSDLGRVPNVQPRFDLSFLPDLLPLEICNGRDDNENGQIDEPFDCRLWDESVCITACGSRGMRACQAPLCSWGQCIPPAEECQNGRDDDCDGLTDCKDPDCAAMPFCAPPPDPPLFRYEFRVSVNSPWVADEPFYLRDQWWGPVTCANTNGALMQNMGDGWHRCDIRSVLSPFVGSFFSRAHPDWGDRGNLGTVGNAPRRCTPTEGVEWRIQDVTRNRNIFAGPVAGLPCVSVGEQDRHQIPPY